MPAMKRTLYLSIIREITSLFLLGLGIFTLVLLMGRMIKLTEMVISRGVALADMGRMIICLMPSFLVYTIPMAFLLAVLLTFGRLSADSEITVMKACGSAWCRSCRRFCSAPWWQLRWACMPGWWGCRGETAPLPP